ncbi:MAG: NAD-dependent epimerase/dehydratase family protein [Acidimicrobiia bacterium]|nr:NAD-dependent epimerase/dehydratase family protein [Acidimicrobiia bacterium]MDH3397778.1 NAD-dependent epimerase/dehydratase family protein [Acidimicrobiia bacterium]MDH5615279.1 NAD-dependent epimerase/dehydratase family protein [Acidimicrobiia bacterium]
MTIVVTGASGFIGGELTRMLVERGEQVRILARPSSNLDPLDGLPLDIVRGELDDSPALARAMSAADVVFHCAALAADWGPWSDFERANVSGVKNLLQAAVDAGTVQRFVHVSTSDVYGYPRTAVDESYPLRDVGYNYNRSKIMSERLVDEYLHQFGLPTTIIRPVTVFGPRSFTFTVGLSRLLLDGDLPFLAKGRARAGLIYIDDLIEGMISAASEPAAIGQAYNLRDPSNITWRESLLTLADGLGASTRPRNIPTPVAVLAAFGLETAYSLFRIKTRPLLTRQVVYAMTRDQGYPIEKAEDELGFAPTIGVDEGFRRTIEWLRSAEGQKALTD